MTAGRRLAVTESAVIIRDCAVKVLGISCSLALLDKSHDVTHFSYGYCAHCVLFSCIISTADADSIMVRAESKYSLFFRFDMFLYLLCPSISI